MEVKGDRYRVTYEPTTSTVTIEGILRLRDMNEYGPIVQLLDDVAAQESEKITLDLSNLQFLNSSGFNVLTRFVMKMRQKDTGELAVQGSRLIFWQQTSLKVLQGLMPALELQWQ